MSYEAIAKLGLVLEDKVYDLQEQVDILAEREIIAASAVYALISIHPDMTEELAQQFLKTHMIGDSDGWLEYNLTELDEEE